MWFKHAHENNGFSKIVKACNKINTTRANAEVKRVKDQAKAEAKAKQRRKQRRKQNRKQRRKALSNK